MRSNSTGIRRRLALRGMAVIAGALGIAGGAGPLQAMPRLVVEEPLHDFGRVTNAVQLCHDFVLRNAGDSPLHIRKLVSGCESCLTLQVDELKVSPGERTLLHCCLDARQLSGGVVRVAQVQSDDPAAASSGLELRATLVPLYSLVPADIVLEGAPETVNGVVDIRPLFALREPLSRVDSDNTNIVAAVREVRPGAYQVVVQALETLPRGQGSFTLTVSSSLPGDPPCRISGRINYPREVEVIPSRLVFAAQDQAQTRIIWVRQHAREPVALLDAVPSSGEFHCEIVPDPSSFDYRIDVEAARLESLAGQDRVLTLKARNAYGEEFKLSTVVMSVCATVREMP